MELRDRLRALRTSTEPYPEERPKPAPLPYLQPVKNEAGCTYYCDRICIDYHGQIDLKNFPEPSIEDLRFLSLDPSLENFTLQDTVFLDIETTGTSGGAGTFAFLVGLGFVERGYFQVRQYFLHDLAEESAFLRELSEFVKRFRHMVTYNGKCFDAQILRTRYLLHRSEDPFEEKQHIDMLFIARRLWKQRFRDCDLMNLERQLLNFYREDDIPGYLIPSAYANYLRFATGSLMQKVIHHNQWDIISLAVLTARACQLKSHPEDLCAVEHFSLSRLYERQKQYSRAIEHQLQALQQQPRFVPALISLSRNLRRVKDHERMRWLVEQSRNESLDPELCRRLAILCEHDLREPALALQFVTTQMSRLQRFQRFATKDHGSDEWLRRSMRLKRKLDAGWGEA